MRATQKAGKGSIQIHIDNMNVGLTVEEVKELLKEKLSDPTITLSETEKKRLEIFTNILASKLTILGLSTEFYNDDIQPIYNQLRNVAIRTDRKLDYEMLAELYILKMNYRSDYIISASIDKAISIISNLSVESLMTLTIVCSLLEVPHLSGITKQGLKELDDFYTNLLRNFNLPINNLWISNLEIVDIISIVDGFSEFKNLEDILYDNLDGYFVKGLAINSEQYHKAVSILTSVDLPEKILVKNDINEEYMRIPIQKRKDIEDLPLVFKENENFYTILLAEDQKEALIKIFDSYEEKDEKTKEEFINLLNQYNSIKKIIEWWDTNVINYPFKITQTMKTLAIANINRLSDY